MGNAKSSDFSKKETEDLQNFLKLQSTAFFNDTFITTLAEKLPVYGFPDPDAQGTAAEPTESIEEYSLRLRKLLPLFTSDTETTKVEDDSSLSLEPIVAASGFHMMSAKRSRVLLRTFHVRLPFLAILDRHPCVAHSSLSLSSSSSSSSFDHTV